MKKKKQVKQEKKEKNVKKEIQKIEPENESIVETDVDSENKINTKEIEIGTYKHHVETITKGMSFGIWISITSAILALARPNLTDRIDLRDKEMLQKLEKDFDLKIDYQRINEEIARNPWLLNPNGFKEKPVETNKDNYGKPLTKKAIKSNAKKDKIQGKIDILQSKYDSIKNKKCERASKIQSKIEELQKKKDRV